MKFKTPYYANFNIPPCCAVCGDVPGQGLNWEVSGYRSNWNGKRTTSISLEVPLCQECYTVSRDKGLVKFLNVIGVLFAIGICFSFTFFLSTPSKSIGIAVLVTILWVVLYRWLSNTINVHGFTPEQRERRKHVLRCVKILSFDTPSSANKNGSVVFEFDSSHFALLFSIINSGELSALPDRSGTEPVLPARKTPGQTPARLAGVTAPVPGSVMEATPYPAGCVNCGVQRQGQNVVIYYGNKQAKSKRSYGDGKTTTVITTTTYTVGGSDEVSICDHCTKVYSRWRFFNVLWSLPMALGFGGFFVWFVVQLFSGGIHGGFNAFYVVLIFFCGLFGITKTVDYVKSLVKPLNETARAEVARPIVRKKHSASYNTFWTATELAKLQNPNLPAKSVPRAAAGGAPKHPAVAGGSSVAATIPDKTNAAKEDKPTCAECRKPFSWDEAYHHQDTPGSAPYNPPGHGIFRPRAYCPNCGALVAEWHIDQVKDYDEWAWYGNNATLNGSKPLPPSPLYLWGKAIPVQLIPTIEQHQLALAGGEKVVTPPEPVQTGKSIAESTLKKGTGSAFEHHDLAGTEDDVIKTEQCAHTTTETEKKGETEMSNEETITKFLQQLGASATPFMDFPNSPGLRGTVAMYMGLGVDIQIHQGTMLVAQFVVGYLPKMNTELLLRQLMILNSSMIGVYFCIFSANNAIVLRTSRVIEGLDFVEFKQALDTLCLAFLQNARPVAQTFQLSAQPV